MRKLILGLAAIAMPSIAQDSTTTCRYGPFGEVICDTQERPSQQQLMDQQINGFLIAAKMQAEQRQRDLEDKAVAAMQHDYMIGDCEAMLIEAIGTGNQNLIGTARNMRDTDAQCKKSNPNSPAKP